MAFEPPPLCTRLYDELGRYYVHGGRGRGAEIMWRNHWDVNVPETAWRSRGLGFVNLVDQQDEHNTKHLN
ncbi:unnamed protein product [Amoebophrya sp. A25]|nr:unnamed protein product [Amoebophrya sp. A25]|eukprot:GSA25T00002386001.1